MTYLEIFHHLHEHPELSFEEFETTQFIKDILEKEEIEILNLPLKTGLVAKIKGGQDGKTTALRVDIDALPIEENTSLPYKSKVFGKMHACGHDIHTTIGIETARILNQRKNEIRGEVLIIFQPSEENGKGALEILKTGVFENIAAIFSLHSSPVLEVGEIGIKEKAITSAVDLFKIRVKGRGCHGAQPQDGIDPIVAAAGIVLSLQTIVSRNINPFNPAVLSVTHIEGGSNWNVIPDEVLLEGTFRTTDKESRKLIGQRLKKIAESTAEGYGVQADVELIEGPPSTNNDDSLADLCRKTCEDLGLKPVYTETSTVGEDFAYYQEKCKGIMVWLGVGKTFPLHNPKFEANPKAIEIGATLFSTLLLEQN